MEKKKYYYKKNNKNNYSKNYYKNNNKTKDSETVSNKKLTYDEIVNVREDVSEIPINNSSSNIATYRFIAISIILLAIIFGSLLLFRVL